LKLKELKTPYFMLDKAVLDEGVQNLKESLKNAWGNYIIGYSYKTNALPWVIKYFRDHGIYAEVVSDDEFNLAMSIGVRKSELIYNGIAKSKETFLEAVKNHAIVNIDAEYEIDWLDELSSSETAGNEQYEVGIRINFDLESRCPGHSQCPEDGGRFGFCYENGEFKRAFDRVVSKGIKVAGIHLHKSSKTRMPAVYKAIAEVAVEIGEKYGLDLSYVDIGGGFFGGLDFKPQFPEYFDMVADILKEYFTPEKTTLIVEPGNALIASPIEYHTTVLDVKETIHNTFVVTDGSRTQIDPLMTKSSYFHKIVRCGNGKTLTDAGRVLKKQVVCGFTCMEHDRLFELDDTEELKPGDQIIYQKVGAYTMCLTPLFIKWFPDVYLKDGDELSLIRDRWTDMDYKGNNTVESEV